MKFKNMIRIASLCALLATGCNETPGVKIPLNTVYYPSFVVADPQQRGYAYLVNANFDLQYTSGSILVLDLSSLTTEGQEQAFINEAGSIRISSFGGQLVFKDDASRALIPIRGETAVLPLTLSADGQKLSCRTEGPDCNEKEQIFKTADFALPEKYYEYIDDFYTLTFVPGEAEADRFVVASLGYSAFFPFSWPFDGMEVRPMDAHLGPQGGISDLIWHDGTSQLIGSSQYVEDADSRLFVTSQTKTPFEINYIDIYGQFAGSSVNALLDVGDNKLLLSNTFPHSLVLIDLNTKDRDRPYGAVVWSTALEGESAALVVYDHPTLGRLAFVSIIDTDVIEVFSLKSGLLLGRIATEGGPFSMALVKSHDGTTWLLVTEFYAHGLAIYDISGNSVDEFTLKQRINDGTHKMAKRDN